MKLQLSFFVTIIVLAVVSSRGVAAEKKWVLPLDLGPTFAQQQVGIAATSAIDSDNNMVFVSNGDGTIFAVNATAGHSDEERLLWTNIGSRGLLRLNYYSEIPGVLYYTTDFYQPPDFLPNQCTVVALDSRTGEYLASYHNITLDYRYWYPNMFPVGEGRLSILAYNGVAVTDGTFQHTEWTFTVPFTLPNVSTWATRMTANEHTVAVMVHYNQPIDWKPAHLVTLDVHTGKVLCNISNYSFTFQNDALPFPMSKDTSVIMAQYTTPFDCHGSFCEWTLSWHQINGRTCEQFDHRSFIHGSLSSSTEDGFARVVDNSLFVLNNTRQWVITAAELGAKRTAFTTNLPVASSTSPGVPQVGVLSSRGGIAGGIIVWAGGVLSEINKTTGEAIWTTAPHAIPILFGAILGGSYSNLLDQQFVFPMAGGTQLLVPNLQGYTTLSMGHTDSCGGVKVLGVAHQTMSEPLLHVIPASADGTVTAIRAVDGALIGF